MQAKLNPNSSKERLSEAEKAYRRANGISNNYQGSSLNPQNISANIPDHENCSLFLTNLPPSCSYKDLLSAVAPFHPGRVWSTYITPPDNNANERFPSHRTSAAKIIFYKAEQATGFLRIAESGAFQIKGYQVRAVRNRVKTAEQQDGALTSRCIVIKGPAELVNVENLRALFDRLFCYETEEVIVIRTTPHMRWLEWRFASFRAQAGAAKQVLESEHQGQVQVEYTRDPCE